MKYKTVLKTLLAVTLTLIVVVSPIGQSLYNNFSYFHSDSLWQQVSRYYDLDYDSGRKEIHTAIHEYAKNQDYLNELTHNAHFYLYYIFNQTKARHLPAEIALIPLIESEYNPFDYSRQGATGLWQLMPQMASGYGLHLNWWYDGRRDVMQSTDVALTYLQDLHTKFKDWLLAIAAYDAGEGTIEAAIQKNRREHKPTDFWSLSLPKETKLYVPRLLALAQIIKNPRKYHVHIPEVKNAPYFKAIPLQRELDVSDVAKMSATEERVIRELNPGLRRWTTQPQDNSVIILPIAKAQHFSAQLAQQPPTHLHVNNMIIHHKVKKGESLHTLAVHFHTTSTAIKSQNHLKHTHLHVGENLKIVTQSKSKLHAHKKELPKSIAEDNVPGPKKMIHIVKKHDSLPKIASLYDVDLDDLRFWNRLKDGHNSLQAGEELVIWKRHPIILAEDNITHIHHTHVKPNHNATPDALSA